MEGVQLESPLNGINSKETRQLELPGPKTSSATRHIFTNGLRRHLYFSMGRLTQEHDSAQQQNFHNKKTILHPGKRKEPRKALSKIDCAHSVRAGQAGRILHGIRGRPGQAHLPRPMRRYGTFQDP